MPKHALCWIRRDLRLSDHAALAHATAVADQVTVVFVYDTVILSALPTRADRRLQFIVTSLDQL
ncbi:deoxyribodipyrimidine photo-lyase, partial [Acinetobacter baumannii]